jgi:hypothetical protein
MTLSLVALALLKSAPARAVYTVPSADFYGWRCDPAHSARTRQNLMRNFLISSDDAVAIMMARDWKPW